MIDGKAWEHLVAFEELGHGTIFPASPKEGAAKKRLGRRGEGIERDCLVHLLQSLWVVTQRREIAVGIEQVCGGVIGFKSRACKYSFSAPGQSKSKWAFTKPKVE